MVTASWTHNIWADGSFNPDAECVGDGCNPPLTVIMHWNGTRWKVVPSPNPQTLDGNGLSGIDAIARDDIWAVGSDNTQQGIVTLIVHWNGRTWS